MEQSPAMEKFTRMASEQAVLEETSKFGFMLAFLDATGLRPEDAEMVVSEVARTDPQTHERTMVKKIWFQRRAI